MSSHLTGRFSRLSYSINGITSKLALFWKLHQKTYRPKCRLDLKLP